MGRPVAVLLILVVALAAGGAYVSYRLRPPSVRPLEEYWTATVAVLAGDGVRGALDGTGTRARFWEPFGIVAANDGTIFVADAGTSNSIRRIAPDGTVSTLVRSQTAFRTPSGLALAADGTLFVADTGGHAIRRVTPDGQVTTVAGDGTPGYADGPASQARFNGPMGIAFAPDGRLFVADTYNDRIRVIADGAVRTLAGSGLPGSDDGDGEAASFDTPAGIAIDAGGTLYVADTGNSVIRRVDPNGRVTTPGWAREAGFFRPVAIASGDELYVADEGGRIVAIHPDRSVRTVAGAAPGYRDGIGSAAQFRRPSGVAWRGRGHLVVADAGNALVRTVIATSQLGLEAPGSPAIQPRFDADAFGWTPLLWPVAPFSGPHEIAGSFGEVRGPRGERFHVGIDVRVEQGTRVYAVRDGIVSSPISNGGVGTLDEWLRIGDLTYVHIRAGRTRGALLDESRFVATYDGRTLQRLRVKRGARFTAGELIATVNQFNHVHMNVGWPGEEHNPLRFRLVRFEDTVAPTIPGDGVRVYDESWHRQTTRLQNRLVLTGRVRVVLDAWDQADDNTPNRRLAPYELGYEVLQADGRPAAGFETRRPSLRFDRVAPDPEASHRVYGAGSGIPFYRGGRTRYLYIVTNRLADGKTADGFWDTGDLPPGDYVLRGWAADVSGNVAQRDLPVTVAVAD